jgi:hypothetical protein
MLASMEQEKYSSVRTISTYEAVVLVMLICENMREK